MMHTALRLVPILLCLAAGVGSASAQTKTPNQGASVILRSWPQSGIWQTALGRRDDQTLLCIMLSAHSDHGVAQYFAGLRQLPKELAIVINDRDKSAVSGNQVRLVIDGVEVGSYEISKRADNQTEFHGIAAPIPEAETQRVIALFRTGGSVKFITEKATFEFPLTGADAGIENMRQCIIEAASLAPHQ